MHCSSQSPVNNMRNSASSSSPDQDSEPFEELPNISNELIIEILSWLPVKSLLRFRCVSKFWLSSISSQQFIKTHLKKASSNNDYTHLRLIFTTSHHKFNFKNCSLCAPIIEATNVYQPMKCNRGRLPAIVGSCDGLVCITISQNEVYLWNPSIRKSKKLPKFGSKTVYGSWRSSFMSYGFGYDESSDDYKVVGISTVHFGGAMYDEIRVKVYSLKTDSWSRIRDIPGEGIDQMGCFANGKLHWPAFPMPYVGQGKKILSLDLANETYGEVEQPEYGEGSFDWTLGVIGGCLSVSCYYRDSHVDIWMMKEYGVKESWTKVVLIPNFRDPDFEIFCTPVFLSKNGSILFKFGTVLALYNLKHGSLTYPGITNLGAFSEVDMYVESLVLLNADDGVQRHRA